MRTPHYPSEPSLFAERLATFSKQMADFARGEQFRALREARHLSQEDAAHEIGVSTKALRAWEKGGKIKWPNAKAAAEFFNVDAESLVTRDAADELPIFATQEQLDRIELKLDQILDGLGVTPAGAAEAAEAAALASETRPSSSARKRPSTRRRANG